MIKNDKLDGRWVEPVVAYFEILFQHFPGETEEAHSIGRDLNQGFRMRSSRDVSGRLSFKGSPVLTLSAPAMRYGFADVSI